VSFNFEKLKNLSPEQQASFKGATTKIVCESFVLTGDRDYLTARFAFFQKQPHLFLWSASQAIEKYLKANIILFKKEKISRNHKLRTLFSSLEKSYPDRIILQLTVPRDLSEQGVTYWPEITTEDFLLRLEKIGSPDVRYNQIKLEDTLQDLVLLDRMAFSLRAGLINEPVQACRNVGRQISNCFLDFNYPFAPADHPHPSVEGITLVHHSVSTLEAALNGCYGNASLYKEWAIQHLALSPGTLDRLLKSTTPAPRGGPHDSRQT